MAIPEGKVRLVTIVDIEVAEKIKDYAKGMELSESRFIRNVLTMAIEDNDWLFKAMIGRYGVLFKRLVNRARPEGGDNPADLAPELGVNAEDLEKAKKVKSKGKKGS